MTVNNASEAMALAEARVKWHLIDWQKATTIVKSIQGRIVKAVQAKSWKKVRALQRLLVNSTSAKVLAIRRVTENKGKRTAGIDGETWGSPSKKFEAIAKLHTRGYQAKAVRRISIPKKNGKRRPLGIPTMKDRTMQALYQLGLDPVSETLADKSSYGFRFNRSCADATQACWRLLCKTNSPRWVLEGDIRACFDQIDHQWLLQHIPMNKRILHQWLKSGYMSKQQLFPTEQGTPQGSIISPTLANMVLDGMERAIDEALQIKWRRVAGRNDNPHRIHLVRYADDFIVTADSKEILEEKVLPAIADFLAPRGLHLSVEKTLITHIEEGFDFLGKTIRRFNQKTLVQPSKKSVQTFLDKIKKVFDQYKGAKTIDLIYKLTPMIRGWVMYHRMDSAKTTFAYLDHRIWQMSWQWALRRHPNKGKRWIKSKYYRNHNGFDWTFFALDEDKAPVNLFRASITPIKRHVEIRVKANPYDPKDEMYFEQRMDRIMMDKLIGKRMVRYLYAQQKGCCPVCKQKITKDTGWNTHHKLAKHLGGKFDKDNLVLLHPVCHQQVHYQPESVRTAALTISV
ncbi:MAG: group II intron reverse transcriptase/maturase [Bacteroidota bacterium]